MCGYDSAGLVLIYKKHLQAAAPPESLLFIKR
jgi:hypothetical protein